MTTKNNIPAGCKDSAVGIIPQEWEVKRIQEICKVDAKSLSAKTSPDYEFEYISLSDVDSDSFDISTSHQIFQTAPLRARRIVSKGDVVISTVRPNLRGFFLAKEDKKDLIASTGFAVLTPTECDSQYLLSCFFSQIVSKQFYSLVVGSNYPAVNSSDVAKLKLAVPPIEEQRKIAEILGVWDEVIEKQSRLVERLEVRKRALMQRLLTGRTRLPGFTTPWQKRRMKDCFEHITDTSNGCEYLPMTISARLGLISQKDKFDRVIAGDSLNKYTHIQKGDFAYNKGNSNLYEMGCIYRLKEQDAVVPFVYICFRPKQNVIGEFYQHFFINHGLDRQLKRIITSGARGDGLLNVDKTDFFELEIVYPPIAEQKAIAEVLTVADNEIATHRKRLEALRLQKRGLMQQLLTGKTRVKI